MTTAPLPPQKLTVWCGLTADGLIGPFACHESVDGKAYRELSHDEIIPRLTELNSIEGYYFMQDGAPAHTSGETIQLLEETFQDRLITQKCRVGMEWPARSPDLNPCDYFL